MNMTRLKQRHIDNACLADLIDEGLITPEQEEALMEEFEKNLQNAMETKGYATAQDIHPCPRSEILRRLSGSKDHAGAAFHF